MRFTVLGELRVISREEIALSRPAHRRLLSILLLDPNRAIETDVLIDRFWADEPPQTARAALQTYVSQLRRLIGDGVIFTSDAGYRLDLRGHHLDSAVFGALASAAHTALETGAWSEVLVHAEQALALWHGAPFAELRDDDFALPEITRLEEQRLELIEVRAEALLAVGRTEEALPDLERSVVEHPLRERLREHLMVARARLGRTREALEAYHELRRALAADGLEPAPGLRDLEERILQEDPVLVPPRVRNNLPVRLTTFVGRSQELDELRDLLERTRVLTLTGVGGTGKTRLAIELAQRVLGDHPDGVHFVNLAALTDPKLVAHDTAEAMGLRTEHRSAEEVLRASLESRRVLVLLDNCEHLLDACARLASVLVEAGPGVRVIATSRQPLDISGESIYAVPSLGTPSADARPEQVSASDAVRLFADRVAAVRRGFSLTDSNRAVVSDICRRLDGLPLAIELAAARARSLTLETIAERLRDRFALLQGGSRTAPARHQTLRATIDWSHRLLDSDERTLFARLSIFAGGCTLEAAESICSADPLDTSRVLDLLSHLVDRSLVKLTLPESSDARYTMLETIREFAEHQLAEDESAALRRRHRAWFAGLAAEAVPRLEASDQLEWLDRIHAERDNLATAYRESVGAGANDEAADLAETLGWYRLRQGQYRQGVDLVREALGHLSALGNVEREAALRVRLAGTLYSMGSDDALPEAQRAAALVADRPPSPAKVRALTELASLHQRVLQRDPQVSVEAAQQATVAARAIGDRFAETHALRTLGTALAWAGDVDEGIDRLREALALSHEIDNPAATLGVYMRLHITLLDYAVRNDEADALAEEAITWLEAGGDRLAGAASLLMWFAMGFIRSGRWARAEEILERSGTYHLEGMVVMSYLTLRALLHWSQGRLDEAGEDVAALRATGPRPRYYRVLHTIDANLCLDQGDLDAVRVVADEHLRAEVEPVEEPTKAGTLHALVRAEVDAALDADAPARFEHARRAEAAVQSIRSLIEHYPPRTLAGLQLEGAETSLALAEAELSRLAEPRPDLWRAILERPWYVYWRIYARCRLAESLLALGQRDEGIDNLLDARRQADRVGAAVLRDEIDLVGRRAGVAMLSAAAERPGTSPQDRSEP